jgi:hypothetical protein
VRASRPARRRRRSRRTWWTTATLALVGASVGAAWWWAGARPVDPVAADPVTAVAEVLTADDCGSAVQDGVGQTVVSVPTPAGPVRAVLAACGYREGQRIEVEHLRGVPTQVRMADDPDAAQDPSGGPSPVAVLVTAGVLLLAGTVTVAAARRSTTLPTPGAPTPTPPSVARLVAAGARSGTSGSAAPQPIPDPVPESPVLPLFTHR